MDGLRLAEYVKISRGMGRRGHDQYGKRRSVTDMVGFLRKPPTESVHFRMTPTD